MKYSNNKPQHFNFHTFSFIVCSSSSSSIDVGEGNSVSWSVDTGENAGENSEMTLPRKIR